MSMLGCGLNIGKGTHLEAVHKAQQENARHVDRVDVTAVSQNKSRSKVRQDRSGTHVVRKREVRRGQGCLEDPSL